MNDDKINEKTILHFRDPTLVRMDEIRTIILLEKHVDNDQAIIGYFALILCEIDEMLCEGYVLHKKESILGKDNK